LVIEELRRRLEVLLGDRPEAPPDESLRRETELAAERVARREKLAVTGGQMLSAAFNFSANCCQPHRIPRH
jgi:hypothetical protein